MHTPSRVMAVAAMLISLALAACSDDDDATASSASSSTPRASNVPRPPSTSSSTTSTTTTLAETTTTVDEIALTKAAVAAAAVQSREDYLYAVRNPDAPDAVAVLERSHAAGSPSLQRALDNRQTLLDNGWRVRPHPTIPDSLTVEGEVTLLDGPPASRAEVTVCEIGAGIVYEPGGGPNGEDTIVNDEIVANRNRTLLVREAGVWKIRSGTPLGEWPGESSCPAE
jgi:hypothetical protein